MGVTRLALSGDSLVQGTGPSGTASAYAQGGGGAWSELVRDRLANLAGVGPLISPGLRACWLAELAGTASGEWTSAGSWTQTVSGDLFDKVPYGQGYYANGSTNIRTYTVPNWMPTWHGFAVDWIDYTSGGTWSYRINGGSWTAIPDTPANGNIYRRFYVTQAMTRGQTIDIRAANAAGTGVGCLPVGIRPFFLAPSTTQGLIVDNYGANGTQLHALVASTSGDRMAAFDTVTLGSGGPVTSTPTCSLMLHVNDYTLNNTTIWANDLTTYNTRVAPLGTVGMVNCWESGFYTPTRCSDYRTQLTTTAAGFGTPAKVINIYDLWAGNGWTGYAGANAAGLLFDLTHPSQAGMLDLAPRIYWFVRNQILGLGALPSTYVASAKATAVQYQGKLAAVQYSAGAPIGVA